MMIGPIGIFGGTFDPIHYGHLRPALELMQSLEFEQLRIMPCGQPPHRDLPVADAETRLELVRAAIDDHPHMNGVPPAHELVPVVRRIFEDGIVTEEERDQLLALLERLIGTELDVQY